MLQVEGVRPEKFGYDKPSEKLLGFLAKHYGLKRFVPQNNNYVVFSQYFESAGGHQSTSAPQNDAYTTSYGGGGFVGGATSQKRGSSQIPVQFNQTACPQQQQPMFKDKGGGGGISQIFGTQANFYN